MKLFRIPHHKLSCWHIYCLLSPDLPFVNPQFESIWACLMKISISFLGRGVEEEAYLPEVYLPGSRSRPIAWYEQWATYGTFPMQNSPQVWPWIETKAYGFDQKVEKEEEGSTTKWETRRCKDPIEKYGHCPRNDRIYCWSSQRKNLYTGRNQGKNLTGVKDN